MGGSTLGKHDERSPGSQPGSDPLTEEGTSIELPTTETKGVFALPVREKGAERRETMQGIAPALGLRPGEVFNTGPQTVHWSQR